MVSANLKNSLRTIFPVNNGPLFIKIIGNKKKLFFEFSIIYPLKETKVSTDEPVTLDVSPEESTIKATTDWKFGNSPASTTKRPFLNNSTLPEEKRIIIILTISFVAISKNFKH